METIQTILDFIGTGLYWAWLAFITMFSIAAIGIILMIPVGLIFLIKNIISGMMDLMIEFILWRTIDIGTGIFWLLDKLIKLIKYPFVYLGRLLDSRTRRKKEEGSPSSYPT